MNICRNDQHARDHPIKDPLQPQPKPFTPYRHQHSVTSSRVDCCLKTTKSINANLAGSMLVDIGQGCPYGLVWDQYLFKCTSGRYHPGSCPDVREPQPILQELVGNFRQSCESLQTNSKIELWNCLPELQRLGWQLKVELINTRSLFQSCCSVE